MNQKKKMPNRIPDERNILTYPINPREKAKNKKIYMLVRMKLNYPSGFFSICIYSESDAEIKNVFLLAFCVYAQNPRSKQE